MRRALAIAVLACGCAGRSETMRYEPSTIPAWVLDEWAAAQEEMLSLDDLRQDPRRYGPERWYWVQLETEFWSVDELYRPIKLRGATNIHAGQIIVCCGDREVVRHEAFHAILFLMGDPRYELHYPEHLEGR